MDDFIKFFFQYAVAPLGVLVFWMHKKQHGRVDNLERRVANVERSTAVIEAMIDNIREDIREIKRGIDKLIDRRID
jgi:hypothetical protein